jgi:hypothetical protein
MLPINRPQRHSCSKNGFVYYLSESNMTIAIFMA